MSNYQQGFYRTLSAAGFVKEAEGSPYNFGERALMAVAPAGENTQQEVISQGLKGSTIGTLAGLTGGGIAGGGLGGLASLLSRGRIDPKDAIGLGGTGGMIGGTAVGGAIGGSRGMAQGAQEGYAQDHPLLARLGVNPIESALQRQSEG